MNKFRMRRLPRKSVMSNERYEVKSNFWPLKVEIGQKTISGHNSDSVFVTKENGLAYSSRPSNTTFSPNMKKF